MIFIFLTLLRLLIFYFSFGSFKSSSYINAITIKYLYLFEIVSFWNLPLLKNKRGHLRKDTNYILLF